MRFFAHDGQTVHGPSRVEELTRLPNFDGDTLVCPVGSDNSADWKPALAYPPFRAILLAPKPKPAPAPTPAPPAPTARCPRCAHLNPDKSSFCNACGSRMDGRAEPPPAAAPVPLPAPTPAPAAFEPPAPVAPDPFRLEPSVAEFPAPSPVSPAVAPEAPAPAAPAPLAAPGNWRRTLLAAFASAALVSAALGWWLLRPATKRAASAPELDLTPPAPSSPASSGPSALSKPILSAPASAPAAPAPPAVSALPAPAPAPAAPAAPSAMRAAEAKPAKPAKHAPRRAARSPRAKKAKALSAAAKKAPHDPLEDLTAPEAAAAPAPAEAAKTPESAAPAKPEPAKPAAPADAGDDGFLLPGVPRRVPPASKRAPKPEAPAAGAAPAAAAPAAPPEIGEDASANQVREQFDFCSQLTSQGAYADYFDTCLCASARQAAPYKGSRVVYAAAMKKTSDARSPKGPTAIGAIVLDGPTAKVTTNKGPENWTLEDGLWCKAP
ncbi:MAG: hypothetical protein ACHQ51_09935 [Elusimicrobiota bacterium]